MSDTVKIEPGVGMPFQAGTAHVRPHLAVGPAPEVVENVTVAVAPFGSTQRTGVRREVSG